MRRAVFCPLLLVIVAVLSGEGCSYSSLYVSPADGRARTVWRENNVVVDLSSGLASDVCLYQVGAATHTSRFYLMDERLELAPVSSPYPVAMLDDFWIPVFYGSPILASRAVIERPAVVFAPPRGRTVAPPPSRSNVASESKHGDSESRAFTAAAIAALVILPIVDLVLAINRPESSTRSAQAIDQVHAYNDFARTRGSPCSPAL